MLGTQKVHARLFYEFDLETHIPADHLLRGIDRFLDLNDLHDEMRSFYSHTGRPSIDPGLMIRMLVVGYVMGLRSERRLCQEVHLNLAYRWFCRLGLEDKVPDHSSFSKLRHGKFRDSDIFRRVFERVVSQCIARGLVGGKGFAVDASLIHRPAGHCIAMSREAAPMSKSRVPAARIDGMRPPSIQTMPQGRCVNISIHSTQKPSARPRPSSPSSRPMPILLASGVRRVSK